MGRLSSITLRINPGWGAGILHYSQYAATQQPFDEFDVFVDGRQRDAGPNRFNTTGFEERNITLGPDSKNVTWVYEYNPGGFPAANVPPEQDDRTAAVFLDNVYFDPLVNSIIRPTPAPTPAGGIDDSLRPSTAAPTSIPDGALTFDGFEQGSLDAFPEWTSEGDAPWERTKEQAASGVFSLRSPDLRSPEFTLGASNVTFQTNPAWSGGTFYFSVYAATQMPLDEFQWFVDGETTGRGSNQVNRTSFEERQVVLSPGPHAITWLYTYNPLSLVSQNLPPEQDGRIAAVFLDNVYFVPFNSGGDTLPLLLPSASPSISLPTTLSPALDLNDTNFTGNNPSQPSSYSPTSVPTSPGNVRRFPSCASLSPNPDNFEDAEFPSLPWSTGGAGNWSLSTRHAYNGTTSIRAPKLDGVGMSSISNATLEICDGFTGGTLRFQAIASVMPPYDDFVVYIDGVSAAQLADVHEWTAVALELDAGPHRVDFSYQYNASRSDQMPPSSQLRQGAVWVDYVAVAPRPTKRLFHSSKLKGGLKGGWSWPTKRLFTSSRLKGGWL